MSETTQLEHCGKCGAALSGFAPDGLCAACLMESAFEEGDVQLAGRVQSARIFAFKDYELQEELARGGMGVVYRARQISLNRPVAIKMILGGHLANAAEMQRFRVEAETAAQLQHPNIVAIHEVGEHAGQPFFSMDLVEGRNLAQLVRDEPLPSRKAASYLKTIAEAVQFAHSHGVLHRDLKPSNILIDEADQPRITDFGLAKRLDNPELGTSSPELTQTGQVLGSPSFIPPEQAAGQKDAIGPASDVYSLGAILYHCLTARPPFMAETLTQTLRMVAESEAVSPRLLNASVPRDLETICLKCLEKDPKRRYATAQELVDDLGRFLRDEPIQARPISSGEKAWRWCRRKPALASAMALVLVVAIGSPIAAFHINRERQQAEANERKAQVIKTFLLSMLQGVGPSRAKGRDTVMLREILDETAKRIGTELTNQPEVKADLCLILGKTYDDLGEYTNALAMTQEALRLRREFFGPKHVAVAEALNNLGAILSDMGEFTAAEAKDREALVMRKELLGNEHPDVATSLNNLGLRLWNRSDFAGAEAMHREALRIRKKALTNDHPDVAKSLNNLGMALWASGDYDNAEQMFSDALAIFRNALGTNNPNVATILNNVGTALRDLGRLDEAEITAREAWTMRQKLLSKRHVLTAYSQDNLAIILQRLGRLTEAEFLHRDALALHLELLGSNHQYVAESLSDLAIVLAKIGDLAAAEAMQRDALATAERSLGKDSPDAADSLDRLAILLAARGNLIDAESLLTNALVMTRKLVGTDNPDVIPALWHLSWVLQQRGELAAAQSLHQEAVAVTLKGGNYSVRALTESSYDLADFLQIQGKFIEAEALLLEVSKYLQNRPDANPRFQRAAHEHLVRFYEAWDRAALDTGKGAAAAAWRKKLDELSVQADQKRL